MSRKKTKRRAPMTIMVVIFATVAILAFFVFSNDNGPGTAAGNAPEASLAPPQHPFSGDGYVLQFGSDFKVGMNAVDDLGLSVVVAMDQSGSMADPPESGARQAKYIQAARAMNQIVDFLEQNFSTAAAGGLKLKVGLIGFSDGVNDIFPLTEMNPAGFAKLRQVLADPGVFDPGGKTAIGAALEHGSFLLAQSGTILKSLIVVSDGENNLAPEPVEVLRAINQNRVDVSTVDQPVYTSGTLVSFVGFDIASGGFANLHQEGARITSAADQTELQSALKQILIADITRLEASGK